MENNASKAAPKVHKYKAPSTPGWQLLLQAAQTVTNNTDRDSLSTLVAHLVARREEHIPKERLMVVATAVSAAATKICPLGWVDEFTIFLNSQLGKEGLAKLLKGSGYEIQDCGCEDDPGYHVINSKPDPRILAAVRLQVELSEFDMLLDVLSDRRMVY